MICALAIWAFTGVASGASMIVWTLRRGTYYHSWLREGGSIVACAILGPLVVPIVLKGRVP